MITIIQLITQLLLFCMFLVLAVRVLIFLRYDIRAINYIADNQIPYNKKEFMKNSAGSLHNLFDFKKWWYEDFYSRLTRNGE